MLLDMDWHALRAEFPVTHHWAFLDHAAVAPLSGRARQALLDWTEYMTVNGGVRLHLWTQRIEEVRRLAAQLIHADTLDVAFVKNTSEGVGIVAEGFPWQSGDNMVNIPPTFTRGSTWPTAASRCGACPAAVAAS
jgi:selenocysteine lyase/cysteine desulfurase